MRKLFLTILFGVFSSIAINAQSEKQVLEVLEQVNQYILEMSETENLQSLYTAIQYLHDNSEAFKDNTTVFYKTLILCYGNIGDYKEVLNYYQLYRGTLTPEEQTSHFDVNILNFVGIAYYHLNMPDKAEEVLLIALNEIKKIEKVEDREKLPALRSVLLGLGVSYASLYNYSKALFYLRDAKYLCELNLDFGATYATCIGQMALSYYCMGAYLDAKIYNDTARELLTNAGFKNHIGPHWIVELTNAAFIYEKLGYIEESEKLLSEASSIIEKQKLGNYFKKLLYTAQGSLLLMRGNYMAAKYVLRKIAEEEKDIEYHLNLSFPEYLTQDKRLGNTAKKISQGVISDIAFKFSFLSSQEREVLWKHYNPYLLVANYFLSQNESYDQGTIYNNALFSKGLLLNESTKISERIQSSGDQELIDLLNKMQTLQSQVVLQEYSGDSLRIIKDSISHIDKLLTKSVTDYQTSTDIISQYDWTMVRNQLAKDEVALEFIQIPDTLILDVNDSTESGFVYYAAIVKADYKEPKLIKLCNERELNKIFSKDVTTLSSSGKKSQLNRYISNIYTTKNPQYTLGERLYSLLWKPMEELLDGAKTIYYSPVGVLNSVSFSAIMHENIPLSDMHDMVLLSSTSEIMEYKAHLDDRIANAVIYGGIPYSQTEEDMLTAARSYSCGEQEYILQLASRSSSDRGGLSDLAGTMEEAVFIDAYLKYNGIPSVVMHGAKANEESFKAMDGQSPDLIHLATHGFFLSDEKTVALHPFMQNSNIKYVTVNNALNRSGVCFAGANRAWTGIDVIPRIEDGILTADELSRINLNNTDLVVLSACETGLGETMSSEGVFGLQRALKLAGVKSIIMSLWKVDDRATAEFMKLFYEKWLSGATRHQAFSYAQKSLKERKDFSSPYYWAGFVMLD